MGYTHYWTHKKRFTNPQWALIDGALHVITKAANVPCETDLTDKGRIYLNGIGEDARETFFLSKERAPAKPWQKRGERGWDFCKTAHKPYDLIVTAMLCYLESTFPDHFSVSSDGTPADWEAGRALAAGIFPGLEIYIPKEVIEDASVA